MMHRALLIRSCALILTHLITDGEVKEESKKEDHVKTLFHACRHLLITLLSA